MPSVTTKREPNPFVETLFGFFGAVARAGAAGAIKEGAKRVQVTVREVGRKVERVQELAAGQLAPCGRCGKPAGEHKESSRCPGYVTVDVKEVR